MLGGFEAKPWVSWSADHPPVRGSTTSSMDASEARATGMSSSVSSLSESRSDSLSDSLSDSRSESLALSRDSCANRALRELARSEFEASSKVDPAENDGLSSVEVLPLLPSLPGGFLLVLATGGGRSSSSSFGRWDAEIWFILACRSSTRSDAVGSSPGAEKGR